MSNQRIKGLAVAQSGSDALSRAAGDALYYQATTPLNSITTPDGDVSLNSNKVINLATPTTNVDACNKVYADTAVNSIARDSISNATVATSRLTANQTELTAGTTPLNMNAYKITSLGTATADADALNRSAADARYYLNTTTLDNIAASVADLSMNSQKITNLAAATTGTDAISRTAADARYYLASATLDSLLAPTSSLSLNS